ncbi:MAG TPA: helix-turn-helix domain-containing protein, partial [Geobacteraceae bacterium]
VIERICIMRSGPTLLPDHLPPELRGPHQPGTPPPHQSDAMATLPEGMGLEDALADFERAIIRTALDKTGANVLQTAALLKIPRGTLRYKMEKYGL